ncbi:NADH:ubiquinone oxidoreductase 16.3 kDasubunit [Monoraphidium neglectum]|uniref:NADH:ubiquinone oxidoreductase 16.3 kDasubunit n=1 Tax=Monoraphidium neglectum TaxID=145388 RepID=A0A0D2MQW6_9CHLO|nr:NADH:ubiquinone oxidoreductase 16.3 kDasubunit [Monoraphidium neglectum]KIZ02812.1 NADH:ubiquinone oxidoreductase 16.3 kDasubunit [Monoraphidium neglectum]|eukprot:XP_013901831.1 NADH:ubiquinone oxidoreductase 16.3 kDasubunit [Monoraphidium neglectum]
MLVQATLAAQRGPAATLPQLLGTLQRWFAAEAKGAAGGSAAITPAPSKKDKWAAVKLPEDTVAAIPETTLPGQAFVGDLRSTSGLGLGDGKTSHTSKWLTAGAKSPMDYIQEAEPIKVSGMVVASYGSDDPNLGCPVEYISLKGTSYDKPAVCKYTGNKVWGVWGQERKLGGG